MRGWVVTLLLVLAGCASRSGTAESPETAANAASPRERARAHTELGVSYYEAGRSAVALEELRVAVRADPGYAPAFNALALVHMDLHQDAEAEVNFREAVRIDPKSAEVKNNYGLFLCQRGRPREGLPMLVDATRDPLYATPDLAYKNAGLCARKIGDNAAAQEYFQRALRTNPNQVQSLYNLAELHFARHELPQASDYLTRYMETVREPGAEELWLATRIQALRGNREAAANLGQRLRRNFPGSPEAKAFEAGRFE